VSDYDVSTYGERIAEVYDDWAGVPMDPEQAVDFLRELAGDGPALELGIGTGRIALPLAARGVEVHGIDASAAMVERLRGKPGGDRISVTMGDFERIDAEGVYTLVFVVFNTFFGLLSQDAQVRCFEGVARALRPGGVFALEAFVPDLSRFDRGQRMHAERVEPDVARFHVAVHDAASQRVDSQHVIVREDGIKLYPVSIRYAYPSELDLMARLAGLSLRERWAGWAREPFGAESGQHVSVYERASSGT
jgi:SAM-dependent methyltransferase